MGEQAPTAPLCPTGSRATCGWYTAPPSVLRRGHTSVMAAIEVAKEVGSRYFKAEVNYFLQSKRRCQGNSVVSVISIYCAADLKYSISSVALISSRLCPGALSGLTSAWSLYGRLLPVRAGGSFMGRLCQVMAFSLLCDSTSEDCSPLSLSFLSLSPPS